MMLGKLLQRIQCKDSAAYWEKRYQNGGNSGSGSYHRLAEFKAEIINEFVEKHNIKSVIEWGCGDGNQLSLMNYPQYIGYDVSRKAIELCQKKFSGDTKKQFCWSGRPNFVNETTAELAISLDVIFHLVEDAVFEKYMTDLFSSATRYVIIYSSDREEYVPGSHCRDRKFTRWIEDRKEIADRWTLRDKIPNRYPYDEKDPDNTSISDFYFYEKKNEME